jgi:hypothetical protein
MSALTTFAAAAFKAAATTIGTKVFSIDGGEEINVVAAEQNHDREFDEGYSDGTTIQVVCSVTDFEAAYTSPAKDYQGLACELDSDNWRVGNIQIGDAFATISLVAATRAS